MSRTLKLNPLLLGMLFLFLTFSSYISMLPVAGVSGTLSDVSFFLLSLLLRMRDQRCSPATALTPLQRFVNTSAQGILHAKTGRVGLLGIVLLSLHSCFRNNCDSHATPGTMTGVNSLSGARRHALACVVAAAAHTNCRLHASRRVSSHHIFHNQARCIAQLRVVAVCIDPFFPAT